MAPTVQEILRTEEAPLLTCPACGTETRTRFEECPACGANFFVEPPRFSVAQRRAMAAAAAAVLVVIGLIAWPQVEDAKRTAAAERAARDKGMTARAVARLTREQRVMRGEARTLRPRADATDAERLAARAALVRALEARILSDVTDRARTGEIELRRPVREVLCGPLVRTPSMEPDHRRLDREIGRYDCVATVRDIIGRGKRLGRLGIPFVAAVDFRRFTYIWCRNTPAPGERGEAVAKVRIARECVGAPPDAKPIGNGWAVDEL